MKTTWTFHFTAKGVHFPVTRTFRARATPSNGPEVVFEVDVIPTKEERRPDVDAFGDVAVTLPGRPEETEQLAYQAVDQIAEQVSFPNGSVRIEGGLVTATKIPETEEEKSEIGDKPHLVKVAFQEVPRFMPTFDPAQLTQATRDPQAMDLVKQFNRAKEVHPVVERFLAFFKVLEKAYASGPERKLLASLKRNSAFITLLAEVVVDRSGATESPLNQQQRDEFLRNLVKVRDNCAHLRKKTGYAPSDRRIQTEVEPLLDIVEVLARECINRHLYPDGRPDPQHGPF